MAGVSYEHASLSVPSAVPTVNRIDAVLLAPERERSALREESEAQRLAAAGVDATVARDV